MNARRVVLASALVAAVGAVAVAQQPPLPARDLPRARVTAGNGSISGVIRAADTGLPIRGADIRLSAPGLQGGARGAFTDGDGRYEFSGLPDGQYQLVASKVRYMTMTYGQTRAGEEGRTVQVASGRRVENIDFALPAGGVIVLRVVNPFGEPAIGYRVTLYQSKPGPGPRVLVALPNGAVVNSTDDRGEVRLSGLTPGEYFASVEGAEPKTFFPGTAAEAEAHPITVGLGEEVVFGFDTVASRTVRISGTIIGAEPQLRLERRTPAGTTIVAMLMSVAADGSFSHGNLTAGEYVLTARNEKEMGTLTFQVGTENVSGLVLTMRPVQPIHGRIAFEGTASSGIAQAAFVVRSAREGGGIEYVAQYKKSDWSFEIPATSGSGVLRTELPRGWFLKAVLLDGKDVTDTVLDFRTYQGKTVDVIVTQTGTEISGRVADAAGREVTNYVAIAFAEDSRLWTLLSRYVASVRPDQHGRFSFRGLPPRRYLVAAVDYLPTGQERNPGVLERLRGTATPIALTEGAAVIATVKLQQ
jgi:hypothetical protein